MNLSDEWRKLKTPMVHGFATVTTGSIADTRQYQYDAVGNRILSWSMVRAFLFWAGIGQYSLL